MFSFLRRLIGTSRNMSYYEPDVPCQQATFGIQCFWGAECKLASYEGVIRTRVGYCGGTSTNPTYRNLSDHTEAVNIDFDPSAITYKTLLEHFWAAHDSTQKHKTQYMSAIFYHNDDQKQEAEASLKDEQTKHARPIVTKILDVGPFYNAEDYHQKYILRQSKLFNLLQLDNKSLISSHVAAKLNAYIAGYLPLSHFEANHQKYGLSPDQIEAARKAIIQGTNVHC